MIPANEPMGKPAIASHESTQSTTTTTKPLRRTATAKADIVNAPEAR